MRRFRHFGLYLQRPVKTDAQKAPQTDRRTGSVCGALSAYTGVMRVLHIIIRFFRIFALFFLLKIKIPPAISKNAGQQYERKHVFYRYKIFFFPNDAENTNHCPANNEISAVF